LAEAPPICTERPGVVNLTGVKMRLPPSLLTGHPEVDAQHARILDELDRIRCAGLSGITVLIAFLHQHVRSHFAYEELLMDEAGYPDAERHKAQHREYTNTVARLQEQLDRDQGTAESLDAIIATVEGWVVDHVMRADHKLAAFLRAHQQV
jgi:hemerythrin-like metal-binding protein